MIVTCERCTTQFQLEDSRVPAGGVRVRCSRCKHAFKVSLEASAGPAPAEARAAAAGALFGGGPSTNATFDDEESDWQFNEDPPRSEDSHAGSAVGTAAAANVVDRLLGDPPAAAAPRTGVAAAPKFELDMDGRIGLESGPDSPPSDASEVSEGEIDFASPGVPDSIPLATDAPAAADPMRRSPTLVVEPPPLEEGQVDELGNPAEWDLFAAADDRRQGAFGPEATSVPKGLAFELARADLDAALPAWFGWATRAGRVLAWIGVVAVFAGGLVTGVAGPLRKPAVAPPISVSGSEIQGNGRWIDHLIEGPVYVVSGTLRNEGRSRWPAPSVELTLLDGQGRVMGGPRVATLERSEKARREDPLSSAGDPLHAAGGLSPGSERRFEVLVGRLPENEVRVRMVPLENAIPAPSPAQTAPIASAVTGSDEASEGVTGAGGAPATAEIGSDPVHPSPEPPGAETEPATVPASQAPTSSTTD